MKTITRNEYIYLNSVKNGRSMSGLTLQITDEEYEDLIQYRIGHNNSGDHEEPGDKPVEDESNKEAYAVYDSNILTFYYDDRRINHPITYELNTDNTSPGWFTDNNYLDVTKVVFDYSFTNARPTSTYSWFSGMTSLQTIEGIEYLNTSEVTNMGAMFYNCHQLTELDVSNFNTSNVLYMHDMFFQCSNLEQLDLSNFDTSKVENMAFMFEGCNSLIRLNLNNFNTNNVIDMSGMFHGCESLTSLDISSFNTYRVTSMTHLFYYCSGLKTICVGNNWSTSNVEELNSGFVFTNCVSLKGGAGTVYVDTPYDDIRYARVDGLGGPGYFTAVSYGITVNGKAVTFANKYDVLGNETVYYDDALNTLTLNNASLTSINIAPSAPNNLRIEVCGDCKVAHTASNGNAFITSIASTSIEGNGTLTITSKNGGAGINIKRSSTAGLLVKDIDLRVVGKTAGITGTISSNDEIFYSNLEFDNTNCIIARSEGETESIININRLECTNCSMTVGEFVDNKVEANPVKIERYE